MMEDQFMITGVIIHHTANKAIKVYDNGFMIIQKGLISAIGEYNPGLGVGMNIIKLNKGQFLIPGFIDTHIHAPQYPNIGLGYDMPLLRWLDYYTFPLEEKYANEAFATKVYPAVVKCTIRSGTTTAAYFGTVHLNGTEILADAAIAAGQRAFIGKVNMNQRCPVGALENTDKSLGNTKAFVTTILRKSSTLVRPIITPRFAISCDMKLMTKLGEMARDNNLNIQTHVSENVEEVAQVKEMYPEYKSYVAVYEKAGLLTNKTILAHAVHVTDDEIALLSKYRTSVAHCPSSNTALRSGLCNVRRLINAGINVGLGTDVSGGSSPSILSAMRAALDTSIHVNYSNGSTPLNYDEVLYLATLGGAKALAIDKVTGNFGIGKSFDALVISMDVSNAAVDLLDTYKPIDLLQKFVYTGDDRNISQVFVAGKVLKNARPILSAEFNFYKNKSLCLSD